MRSSIIYSDVNEYERVDAMPTTGDVFRITMCAELFGQDVCNVFHYIVAAWTGNVSLEDVIDDFVTTVVTPVKAMQSSSLVYTMISIADAMSPEVYFEKPYTSAGGATSTPSLPSYAAVGFKLVRTDRTTRNGFKRFAGVIEGDVTANALTNPNLSGWTAIETALAADLTVSGSGGGAATLAPAIVRMSPLDPYQVSEVNLVSSAEVNANVTTQNSRKVGRGN